MEKMQCYCVTTNRFTLRCGRHDWLRATQDFYNEVVLFYYRLYLRTEEQEPGRLTNKSNQQALRDLEIMTITDRNGNPAVCPLPWKRIPLYFRRSAVNGAIAEAKSYLGRKRAGMASGESECFQRGVTFYKGMYRDLTEHSVSLRVWDGENWRWMHCRLKGRELPSGAKWMSPTVLLTSNGASMNIPVKENVQDGRKAKERMQEGAKICSLQFTNEDAFAVGVILGPDGSQKAVRFFRGGMEYTHLCRERLAKIRKSEDAMGLLRDGKSTHFPQKCQKDMENTETDTGEENLITEAPGRKRTPEQYNRKYWMKLKNLNDYYAHQVSRRIVDFCVEYHVGMIVVPGYDERFTRYIMKSSGNWSVLHLSRRIRSLLAYKAWQAGIVLVEVNSCGTSAICSLCGEKIRKHGAEYECSGGHRGNRYLNTARNLGIKCLRGFGGKVS